MILSLFFVVFGIYLGTGLLGRTINGTIESYLPPKIASETGVVITGQNKDSISQNWFSEIEEGLAESRRTGKATICLKFFRIHMHKLPLDGS